ncbi:MAG: phage integrase SAM-like domain-containing protein [Bacteroidota bacterium]
MAEFNFYLKEPKAETPTPIILFVSWNDKRLKFYINESIHPKYWQSKDKSKSNYQRATETKKFKEHDELNSRLDKVISIAKITLTRYINENDQQPSIDVLKELYVKKINNKSETKLDFFEFVEKFILDSKNRMNEKTGKPINEVTIRIYKRSKALLQEFSKAKKKRIDFETIDLDFYHDYTGFLTSTKKFSANTVGKHIMTLKTFLNEATERGLNTTFAFKSRRFKVITEKTDSVYLTESELEDIRNYDLSNNSRLDRVRDLFLVGCWTGLRFSDFSAITEENIKGDFIEIETKKTVQKISIPIHSTVMNIMQKYKGKYPNSLPPAISNAKMNEYIKEFAKDITSLKVKTSKNFTKGGINVTSRNQKFDRITTHTARRSFATNLFLDGVSAITIMKITGHKTEKAFLLYIKVTPNENAKILQLHWQKKKN